MHSEPLHEAAQTQDHPCCPGLSPTSGGHPESPAQQPQKPSSRHVSSIPNGPVEPNTRELREKAGYMGGAGALEPGGPECWS